MQRYTRIIVRCLAVITAYVFARAGVYYFQPVTNQETWFFREVVMCVPRLLALSALVWLNREWTVLNIHWPPTDLGRAFRWGIVPVVLWIFFFSGGYGETFTPIRIVIGCLTSLVVGAFEEYAYRGPLLSALREKMTVGATTLVTAGLFTVYHVQAQPFTHWGGIFLMGIIFANLRFRGLSVAGLALIHWMIDALYFFFTDRTPEPFSFVWVAFQVGLLVYAVLIWPKCPMEKVS